MALWQMREIQAPEEYARCFCASTICGDRVYLHGGYNIYPSQEKPFSEIVLLDPSDHSTIKIDSKSVGPARSHHTAVSIDDRYICITGGWDGKKRTADVWLFDVQTCEWIFLKPSSTSKPPAVEVGSLGPFTPPRDPLLIRLKHTTGLSSHTCTLVGNHEMIITGREGGVRMQRKYGSVFKLKVDLAKSTHSYQELPHRIASRSGHTACLLHSNHVKPKQAHLLIIGGRDSTSVDLIPTTMCKTNHSNGDLQKAIDKLMADKSSNVSSTKPMALKHHVSVPAGAWSIIHGGEVFGKVRDCVNSQLFIHDSSGVKWRRVDVEKSGSLNSLKRYGHCMAWSRGKLYILGGVTDGSKRALSSVIELEPDYQRREISISPENVDDLIGVATASSVSA